MGGCGKSKGGVWGVWAMCGVWRKCGGSVEEAWGMCGGVWRKCGQCVGEVYGGGVWEKCWGSIEGVWWNRRGCVEEALWMCEGHAEEVWGKRRGSPPLTESKLSFV